MFGAVGCDLSGLLSQLSTALEQAGALGLYSDPNVAQAQALYDAYSTSSPPDCAGASTQLGQALGRVQGVVIAVNGSLPEAPSSSAMSTAAIVGVGLLAAWAVWWGITK